jgi:hydroxyacylglutathione hydrolase
VDCGEAEPVFKTLAQKGWELRTLFLTHYHPDHSAGVSDLINQFKNIEILKPAGEQRIGFGAIGLEDSDKIELGNLSAQAILLNAHTKYCTALSIRDCLFVGDVLFSGGCGRLFEGTAADLLKVMDRLKTFHDHTKVYVGHEYTLENLKFALHLEPQNADLIQYKQKILDMLHRGIATTPTTIGRERKINPFLRIDEPTIIQSIDPGMTLNRIERMGILRRKKDIFKE